MNGADVALLAGMIFAMLGSAAVWLLAWRVTRRPAASAIEAATAGETTKIGSTEGESATAESRDAQPIEPIGKSAS